MTFRKTTLLAALLSATALSAQAADLRVALQSDPDILDPDPGRSFVGRIVFTALCMSVMLHKKFAASQWLSVVCLMAGVSLPARRRRG